MNRQNNTPKTPCIHLPHSRRRYRRSITCLTTSALLLALAPPLFAHGQTGHVEGSEPTADVSGQTQAQLQVFDAETLRIPDAPTTDSSYNTAGFVSRLHDQGMLLISFTYTGCETLCPVSNAILQQLDQELNRLESPGLHIVTLSIDPEHDTPEALAANEQALGASDNWTSLTADPQSSQLLLSSLGVDPGLLAEHDPMFLLGDLSDNRFVRIIGMPDPERILQLAQASRM